MDMIFEKQGAFVQESLARLRKVNSTYRGGRRLDEFEKVLTEFRERYERLEQTNAEWQLAFMDAKELVVKKRAVIEIKDATIETLRAELAVAHERLANIAEHYDEEHESDIPALGFLNLKEKA
jgi:hypothetical protein